MTEEDTYNALRRIPIEQLEERLDLIVDTIRRNEELRRADELRHEKEKNKRFYRGSIAPGFDTAIPHFVLEGTFNHGAAGTGWTYYDYIKEVRKDIKRDEDGVKAVERKRTMFAVWCFLPFAAIIFPTIFIIPIWLKIPFGLVVGIAAGRLMGYLSTKIYPSYELSNRRRWR